MGLGEPLVWASRVVITFLYMPRKLAVFSAVLHKTTKVWESFMNSFCTRPKTLTAVFFQALRRRLRNANVRGVLQSTTLGSKEVKERTEMKLHSFKVY